MALGCRQRRATAQLHIPVIAGAPLLRNPPTSRTAMNNAEQQLIEKLRRIEALFARPGTAGEREAAARARERILQRLGDAHPSRTAPEEPLVEYRFSLADPWSRRLLHALLARHGIKVYRRRGQRSSTVLARVSRRFVDEQLWPEFCAFERELRRYLDECTDRIIERALQTAPARTER